jgi:hypothetical protein
MWCSPSLELSSARRPEPASLHQPRMLRSGSRRLPAAAALLLAAILPWLAGGRAAAQEPRFLIEKITVEGVRGRGAQIIISQSYLKTGQSYTERELQEAVYRVKHLPFVVDADLALRKGSVRDSYELVVTVEETRPLFLEVAPQGVYVAAPRGVTLPPFGAVSWASQESLTVRQVVGSEGLAFGSYSYSTGNNQSAEAGYTQYNLFGNGSYATLQAADQFAPGQHPSPSVSGSLGVVLSSNLTLVLTPGWAYGSSDLFGSHLAEHLLSGNLALIYRTTDDPFIPTRGEDLEAVVSESHLMFRLEPSFYQGLGSQDTFSLELTGTKYWPLTRRQSVGVNLEADREQVSGAPPVEGAFPGAVENAVLQLLYSARPWSDATVRRLGDLRFEASVGDTYGHADLPVFLDGRRDVRQLVASVGAAYRNQWGLLLFNFQYIGREVP